RTFRRKKDAEELSCGFEVHKNEAKVQNRDVRNKVKKLTPVISEKTTGVTLFKNISDQNFNQRANFTDWLTPFSVTTIT
uniref:hypothetical protein n=1 Tax=Parabacteroides johnsonii TaxID=387661 RepID=UPI0026DA947B